VKVLWSPRSRSIGVVDALGITGVCGLLVARFVPMARLPFWGCLLRQRFGWPCLGCGLTRVADRMSHFNVADAWDANPLGTVAALGFMAAALWTFLHLAFRVPVAELDLSDREWRWVRVALVVLVVANWAFVALKYRHPELFHGA